MPEHFIPGIRPLQQFMEDGSFLMPEIPAVYRAVQALNAPDAFDYDYLLSISGMAVRLVWQPGWAEYASLPNQGVFYNQDDRDIIEIALERIGVSFNRRFVADVGLDQAKLEIMDSLDRNIPVIIQEPCVYAAVLGYRGNTLYGVSTFADADKRIAPYRYNAFNTWEAETKSYLLIESFTPRHMDEALLQEVLRTAVHQARTARRACLGDTALGVSAFDALAEMLVWDEGFAQLTPGKRMKGRSPFPMSAPKAITAPMEHGHWINDFGRATATFYVCSMVMKTFRAFSNAMPVSALIGTAACGRPQPTMLGPAPIPARCGSM